MKHFKRSEFLSNGSTQNPETLRKIDWWIKELSLIRELCGFPITITDGVRYGEGTSQHYYSRTNGAVDIRPSDYMNKEQFVRLGAILGFSQFKRVCFYLPSSRFTYGGFHVDMKEGYDKPMRFINSGVAIDWTRVSKKTFVDVLWDTYIVTYEH